MSIKKTPEMSWLEEYESLIRELRDIIMDRSMPKLGEKMHAFHNITYNAIKIAVPYSLRIRSKILMRYKHSFVGIDYNSDRYYDVVFMNYKEIFPTTLVCTREELKAIINLLEHGAD